MGKQGLHLILAGLAAVPWAHSDLWTWERAVLGFAHLPFYVLASRTVLCNLLQLVFPSNAGNILISPAPPMAPWSGG